MEPENCTLLVVDDNEMNRDMLSRRLIRKGYNALIAEDGKQALEMIDNESIDLVLLDIMMPGIDGIQVLKTARETFSMSELPIIMVTAKDQSDDIVGALNFGANDYVAKPIDFPVVLARIEAQLARRDLETKGMEKLEEKLKSVQGQSGSKFDSLIKIKNSYLIKETGFSHSLALFSGLTKSGEHSGLCLTMKHPEVLKEMYEFGFDGDYLWLSASGTENNAINPSDLTAIHGRINEFTNNNDDSAVIFLGLEYLITMNEFEKTLRFLNAIIDTMIINKSRLIIPIDPETLDTRQLKLLENTLIEIKSGDLIRLGLE